MLLASLGNILLLAHFAANLGHSLSLRFFLLVVHPEHCGNLVSILHPLSKAMYDSISLTP